MSDDGLIAGAAAPARSRRITSVLRLDVVWVLVASAALGVSSFFDLIDLPNARLNTGEAPLRVFVIGLPLAACVLAAVATRRDSELVAAAATGVLAPGVALTGSLSMSLFLDEASAFADVGVAISLAAALVGVVMFSRWLVYHPLSLLGDEERPDRRASLALVGLGAAFGVNVVGSGLGDGVDVAWFVETAAMLLVPALIVTAGLIRTSPVVVLAATATGGQVAAVLIMKVEQSEVPFDSTLALRTGVNGLFVSVVAIATAIAAVVRSAPDDVPVRVSDDESWRWVSDD